VSTSGFLDAFTSASGAENSVWYLDNKMTFLAEGSGTNGQFALIKGWARKGSEPPPHTHSLQDETYYVLSGRLLVTIGGQEYEVGPGEMIFHPRGIEHTFKILTEDADVLMLFTPAGIESYFRHPEISVPATSSETPPDVDFPTRMRAVQLLAEYGVTVRLPSAS
jgi:quercetin dioxygenase-like cupin family protein